MDIIEFLDISSIVSQPYGEREVKRAIQEFYEDLLDYDALELEADYAAYKSFKE